MSLTPEQATFIARLTLPTLKNEHQITMRVIEAIPLGKGSYRPDDVAKSALELAWHIVTAENRFLEAVASGRFDSAGSARPDDIRESTDIASWYAKAFAGNIEKLKGLPGEDLLRTVDFHGTFQLPAFAYLTFAVNHSIHHRGQLSTYLRPMGAKVPSIYGESYDAAQARLKG
jgi:uncharacterized damage-inducible protein DinB